MFRVGGPQVLGGRTFALLHIGINSSYFACMACMLPPRRTSPP